MKKKLGAAIGLVVVVAAVVVVLVVTRGNGPEGEPKVVKVGAVLPLSGPVALFGEWIRNGLDLGFGVANEQLREKGISIQVLYEDSRAEGKTAVAAFNKMLATEKPVAVISAMTRASLPIIPLADAQRVTLLLQDVTFPAVTEQSEMAFRHFIQSDREATVCARFAYEQLSARKAAVLIVNDEAGRAASEAFTKAFEGLGGQILLHESYGVRDRDIRSQVAKIKQSDAQVLFLFGNGPSWGVGLKQVHEGGVGAKILTNTAMAIAPFRKIAGAKACESVYFTMPAFDESSEDYKLLSKLYLEKHGTDDVPLEAAYAWDVASLIAAAVRAGARDKQGLHSHLSQTTEFKGVFGVTKIQNREILTALRLCRIEGGRIHEVKVYHRTTEHKSSQWKDECLAMARRAKSLSIDPKRTAVLIIDMIKDGHEPGLAFDQMGFPLRPFPGVPDSIAELLKWARAKGVTTIAFTSCYAPELLPSSMAAGLQAMNINTGRPGSIQMALPGTRGPEFLDFVGKEVQIVGCKSHFSAFAEGRSLMVRNNHSSALLRALMPDTSDRSSGQRVREIQELYALARRNGTEKEPAEIAAALRNGNAVVSTHEGLQALGIRTLILAGGSTHVCLDSTLAGASQLGYEVVIPIECVTGEDIDKHWCYLHNAGMFKARLIAVEALEQEEQ